MRVRQYPPQVIAEAEGLSYERSALGLEEVIYGTLEVTLTTTLGDHMETEHQLAPPDLAYFSWAKAELGPTDNRLTVDIELSHNLPVPRLPHEYRAWLA
jgi:hypothetical protein